MNPESSPAESQPIAPQNLKGGALIDWLNGRMIQVLQLVESTEFWRVITHPSTDPLLIREMMKEVYLEIYSYQQVAIEGAIASISQMPRSMPVRMVKAMLRHQAEEFDHGEMALRDYVALGGSEDYARHEHRTSPASFAVAAVWHMIAELRDPFAYLGALYPFEGLTPIVSERVKAALVPRGFPVEALEFVEFHSTEDPKHTELVRHLIQETVTRYPEAERSIREGLERFLHIYPLPVWQTAYDRAVVNFREQTARQLAA